MKVITDFVKIMELKRYRNEGQYVVRYHQAGNSKQKYEVFKASRQRVEQGCCGISTLTKE